MPDETTVALQEIAAMMRRRVEQQDESTKRMQEHRATLDAQATSRTDISNMREENNKRIAEMTVRTEQQRIEKQLQQEQQRQEEQQFKQQLIAELQRHNALLERLLEKMT